jgi:hypothetical protein
MFDLRKAFSNIPGQFMAMPRNVRIGLPLTFLALAMCACCGRFSTGFHDLTPAPTHAVVVQTQPAATAQPTKTPKPTATPNLIGPYSTVVVTDSSALSTVLGKVSDTCGAGDVKGCRAAVVALKAEVNAYQADLDAHPAPACLKLVDTHLRAGLNLLETSAQEIIDGIDQVDPDLVSQGTTDMSAGGKEIQKAVDAKKAAKC